jgi:hypothetical protein
MYNAIYHCPSKKTTTSCSKVLAEELDMRIIKTAEDGNCFFDTLATYGWAYHILSLERSPYELRQIMVDYIFNHLEDYHESIIVENGEDLFSTIEWLRGDGNYKEDMGDLVSQIAADTFEVNIYIYNVEPPTIRRLRANQKPYPGGSIHMLRVGEHYKLLLPEDDAPHVIGSYASAHKNSKQSKAAVSKAAVSKTAKNSNNSKNGKNGNSVHKLSKAFSMASISNHTHKNYKNHGNNSNHENHGIYEFNEKMDYKKITIKDLIAFLLSNNMNDNTYAKIEAISSVQKKKEAYYALYDRLFKKK